MLSTRDTLVVNDGIAAKRAEKTAVVVRSEVARAGPCVRTADETSCMKCENCLRTAIALDALGVLDRVPAFGKRKLDLDRVARLTMGSADDRYYDEELHPFCLAHGRADLASAVLRALERSRSHDRFRPLVRWLRRFPVVAPATHWLESLVQDPARIARPRS